MTTTATDGDLTFDASTNTLNCPNLNGSLTGTADTATLSTNVVGDANRVLFNNATNTTTTTGNFTYDGTQLNVAGDIRADGIRLGFTDGTTIDTVTGDLKLTSSNNKVVISSTLASSSKDTGALVVEGGLGVEGSIHAGNDIIAFSSSDVTLKKDITPIENALEMINKISGNTFTWNTGIQHLIPYKNGTKDTGILAQEVEALGLPGVTTTRGDGVKAVRYERLIPVLIEAVKELTAKVKSLESNK